MNEMLLLTSGQLPAGESRIIVHWEERNVPSGHISLPLSLDSYLLKIRSEHMRWAYACGVTQVNGQPLAQALCGNENPSMWWTSILYERHPKMSPNLYIIYKLRCLELLVADHQCQSLLSVGANGEINSILHSLCQKMGIAFKSEGKSHIQPRRSLREIIYNALPSPLRALLRLGHWQWKVKKHLPFASYARKWQKESPLTATIVTYFPNIDLKAAAEGRFHSRYWESLHKLLNEEARKECPDGKHFVRWLFIRFPSPQLNFQECLRLRNLFNKKGKDGLTFNYLEEFLTSGDILTSLKRWYKIAVKSHDLKKTFASLCHFDNSKLNFWPLIKSQWDESFAGWRCLERCFQNQAFKNYVHLAGPQRWNLFPLENCPWERMFTEASRSVKDNGPVFGAQHSIVRPTDFRYFDDPRTFEDPRCAMFQPDIIGGNGESACSQWLANNIPKERIRQLEALRYLYLAEEKNKNGVNPNLPPEPGEPLLDRSKPRLLVLTSFFEDETKAHLALLAEALDAGILNQWEIVLKPHPYLPVNDWLENRPKSQQKIIQQMDGPMALALQPGIFVWTSNSTTAALEAALKSLPLMVMFPTNDFDLCPIQNVPGLLRTGTLADVKNGLLNMKPLQLTPDYLDLNPELCAWRKLLNLHI